MQTAYVIHMSEGPSIRRIISTTVASEQVQGKPVKLDIQITDCDENFHPVGSVRTLTSEAARKSWRRKLWQWETPEDGEAAYHYNLRRQLANQYNGRYETVPTLSDPL